MKIPIQWLIDHAWIFYVACGLGVIVYTARALIAHRERGLAMFTLEEETATARAIQAWATVFVFVAIGVLIFISATFILPDLPGYTEAPLPTSTPRAGVRPLTPTPTEILVPTLPLVTTTVTVPPPSESTEPPTAAPTGTLPPTATPRSATSGEVYVRFGDFAELVSYSLSATEVTTSEPLLVLTLHWQALEGTNPVDYLVFTHLLSKSGELRIIAQHDGAPAGGTRPTSGWASGETIVDSHTMEFKPEHLGYTGPAAIAIGLYDPATGRIPTETGDDHVVLPVTVNVVSQ